MPIRLNPYIQFQGNAREAMEFYQRVLGGELVVTTYAEGGTPHDAVDAARVMHAQLETPGGEVLMASDNSSGQPAASFAGISMSLSGDDDAVLSRRFDALSEGGAVPQPLIAAPWGDKFGIVSDRYGLTWFVNISAGQPPA